ncbi:hypothetical protein [Caulobacter sp. FWC2]|uniref:hypothetical protein n=1 Tax=Caulobacter sp. FWC2 TaxID=69664 RepID=UPI000C150EC1|nr:hypothetical protein [Caulobacter sp. FWC2]PIB93942.1 hypothetical protein CSW62_21640 [Caulobacter sp. FWC2]
MYMNPVGSDGRPIPTPPVAHPWRRELLAVGKSGLGLGLLFLLVGPTINLIANPAWLARGWSEIGLTLLRTVAACLIAGQLISATFVLVYLACWPLIRKQRGYRLERQIDRLSPEMLAESVEVAEAAADAAQNERMRRGWADWGEWLQARAALRRALSQAPPSWAAGPKPSGLAKVSIIPALLIGFSVWMVAALASQAPEPWLYVFPAGSSVYAAYLYGKVATLRVELTADRLTLRRFWRTVWSIPRETAAVGQSPKTGDYGVFDKTTGKEIGVIAATPFKTSDLETLADWFRFTI